MSSRPELKFSDRNEESSFVRFFNSLPAKDPATVRVFERTEGYTVHGEDAKYIAQTVYRTTSVLKYIGGDSNHGLASCTLSVIVFKNFLKDALLSKALKVDIYTPVKGAGRNSTSQWNLSKHASPGNLQAVEDLITIDQKAVVIAVKVVTKADQRTVGASFVDASARELGTSEFPDNELFSNLESLVIQLGAKECVLPKNENQKDPDLLKIRDMVDRCGLVITEQATSNFNGKDTEQDLTRLLKVSDDEENNEGEEGNSNDGIASFVDTNNTPVSLSPQLNQTVAMGATAALIKYLQLMTDPENYGKYRLIQHDLSQYMRLDTSALKALNLMPGPRDGAKSMSLFGLLNRCKTMAGTRLLGQWLKQPLMDVNAIRARHLLVEIMMNDTGLRQSLQEDHLQVVPDLGRLVRKFQKGTANLEDVVRVYQLVIRLPDFIDVLSNVRDDESNSYSKIIEETYTASLRKYQANLEKLQELVETTVDLAALDRHEFIIKPDFDDRLKEIRNRLDDLRTEIANEHIHAGDDLGMEPEKKLKLEQHHIYGWCMRLTRTDSGCLRTSRGYVELSTQKAGVYFYSFKMKQFNEEYTELDTEYRRTQSSLVREVVNIAATYCTVLESLSTVLAHLDLIVSFAHVSAFAPSPYVRPKMHERHSGNTILRQARHPCMEVQDEVTFIPNDVELIRGESDFLIITGPNMGGKSTYIRQIGVIALMAQIGCFVPCAEAELTIFDSILARVGAGDSQLKGVSTFMAEMLETATILKSATRESLIVIDELGRGTSTYDGFGLAWAISEYIVKNIGCFAMFATHFHELTALADNHPGVCNLHVVAHVEDDTTSPDSDITLLYKVEKGISDQSFGIHVAEVVKFPPKVVKMAKRKANELEDYEGDDNDEVLKKATKKFSTDQINQGNKLMREILTKWRKSVDSDEETSASLEKLRSLISTEYEDKFKSDPYIQEIVSQL
ncbi:mismatch repair ATPase MSH2 [Sugiyamaella lignohabitans]|uniref:Mismatch repair ATPase MSH2 n=1 Tax=Sugiyamaella lignohabitans TaxID=796027 RepID=A0A167DCW4_9ASCO|nr:mismatch repair ATPase MSH2 [Sugiyamaella lignohabitans]ANB12773.1 mismatch repair ATPase MSH2 [Sugiyamaella lignohabitans]